PSGLAGLIAMHVAIARTKAWRRVLRAYGIALVPSLAMTFGAVLLIEMSYRVSTQPELGTHMRVLGIALDTAAPWPWLAAIALMITGFIVFRTTWPIVSAAWSGVDDIGTAKRPARQTP